jgi:predicted aspartyl protease
MTLSHRLAAWLAAAITAGACTQPMGTATPDPAAAPGEIPFTLEGAGGAAIVVPVRINDKGPYDFVVDTGATLTCLDAKLADELALPAMRGTIGRGATLGGSGTVGLRRVESIGIGETRATGVTACVLDLNNIRAAGLDVHGLLGLNVLKAYTVTFDFKRNILSLRP